MDRRGRRDRRLAGLVSLAATFAVLIPGANTGLAELSISKQFAQVTAKPAFEAAPVPRPAPRPPAPMAGPSVAPGPALSPTVGAEIAIEVPRGDVRVEVRPGASLSYDEDSRAASRRFGLEVAATAAPDDERPRVWIVGGADSETYVMDPRRSLREFAAAPRKGLSERALAPVGSVTSVGDAHAGLAVELGEGRWASLGYVREERRYQLGTRNWEETDDFVGVSFHARW